MPPRTNNARLRFSPLSAGIAGAVLAAALFPTAAHAGLMWDLRAVNGSGDAQVDDPKHVTLGPASIGTIINLELWAVVTGTDGIVNETFQSALGTLLSSPGLLSNRDPGVAGNGALSSITGPDPIRGNLSNQLLAVWQTGAFSQGAVADLDADGDLDVGANTLTANPGYINGRAASLQDGTGMPPSDFHALTEGREFKISNVTFTVQSIGIDGLTAINFVVPSFSSSLNENARALYVSDGTSKNGADANLSVAPPVVVTAVPEPTSAVLMAAGLGIFGFKRRRRG